MRQRLQIWLGVNANDYRLTCGRRVSSMFVHVFCSILSDLDDPSVRGGHSRVKVAASHRELEREVTVWGRIALVPDSESWQARPRSSSLFLSFTGDRSAATSCGGDNSLPQDYLSIRAGFTWLSAATILIFVERLERPIPKMGHCNHESDLGKLLCYYSDRLRGAYSQARQQPCSGPRGHHRAIGLSTRSSDSGEHRSGGQGRRTCRQCWHHARTQPLAAYPPFFVQLMFVISLCVSYLVVQSPRSEEFSSL
jgi:hypothetical protein